MDNAPAVCQVVCHAIAVAGIHLPAANQRRDETMASVRSKACNKRQKEGYFAVCAVPKLLPKK